MDLGAEGRFSDIPQDLEEALIRSTVARNPQTLGSAVSFGGDKRVTIRNAAGVTVGGRGADMVRWLCGRGARDIQSSAGALPDSWVAGPDLVRL